MKRDALPAHLVRPAKPATTPATPRRAPVVRARADEVVARQHLHAALRALAQRELTDADLARSLQRTFPDDVIRVGAVLERGLALGYIEPDGAGLLGLTEAGEAYAASLPEARVHLPADELSEAQRRSALCPPGVDASALTRSPVRTAASQADLRPPPTRPGADAGLELPSRFGDRLHYRDGRVTDLQGNPAL